MNNFLASWTIPIIVTLGIAGLGYIAFSENSCSTPTSETRNHCFERKYDACVGSWNARSSAEDCFEVSEKVCALLLSDK